MRALLVVISLLFGCNSCDDLGDPANTNCGDNNVDGREVCDGTDLRGESCASQGFAGGTLGCSPACGGYLYAECDGIRNGADICAFCSDWEECVSGRCVSACTVEPFTEDTELRFDITTVSLSGALLVAGAPPVAGELVLSGEVWWDPLHIRPDADGNFQARLEPGTYRVVWRPTDGAVGTERFDDVVVSQDASVYFHLTPWTALDVGVTIAGETPEASPFPGDHGRLVFEPLDPRFGDVESVIGPNGDLPPTFLRPGDYRIWWAHVVDEAPAFEFLGQVSAESLAEREFIDIPVVEAAVRITMNGSFVTADGPVDVQIVRSDEVPRPARIGFNRDRETWPLDDTGAASGWLLDAPRDIAIVVNGPRWWGWLWAARDVTWAEPELTLDVEARKVAGELLRNGGRLPNSRLDGMPRGRLEFNSAEHGYVTIEVPDRGRGEFEVALPRGLWNVQTAGNLWSGALPVVPYDVPNPLSVEAEVDGFDIDVPAVRLAGELTVNGAASPAEEILDTRGSIELRREGSSSWFSVPIPPRGPAAWDIVLAPGAYEAELSRWWFATTGEEPPDGVLPLGRWSLGTLDVAASTRRDIDVRLVELSVNITADGRAPGDGLVWVEDLVTDRPARQAVITEGTAVLRVYPGHYRLLWAPIDAEGEAADPVVLMSPLRVDGEIEQSFDVGEVTLAGEFWVDGTPAQDAGQTHVIVARHPTANATATVAVSPTGPARFQIDVVHGFHDIVLGATPDHPLLPAHGVFVHHACVDEPLD